MTEKKQLQVEAIENGSVIDHIPAGAGVKILHLFNLTNNGERITVGLNLPSGLQGKKDLIKVENTILTEPQANQLALFAPEATINIIKEFQVINKYEVRLPERITGVFDCPNSNCISHHEPVSSSFRVKAVNQDVQLKCKYCEKSFSRDIVGH
ncbi:aspartate carbamoyltransferase regulatory subunit [Dongshaea marina]|uniref:aspartate carbamoyltransferase regulatory subunit n=1 Tax=Dongshaea marina TaxID=2047966 RepID=UPI000D3E1001|nr:aspartate carbamoyltransferase regulatory subunit [Dongshaea marina]